MHRLVWKQALLAQIEQAESAAPLPLPATLALFTPAPFTKISVIGTFLPEKTALYGADVRPTATGPAMGARMIVPLRQTNGAMVLIDRGWAPISRADAIEWPNGIVAVSGYARAGDAAGWFSAKDDPVTRRFYTLDARAIGAAVGEPGVPPFVLVALGSGGVSPGDRWPDPAHHLPRPANSHLSYAITWYGLAIALLAIFVVWARKGPSA